MCIFPLFDEISEILQTIHSKWVKQYGKIFRVWLGLRPFVMTSSAVLIEVKDYSIKMSILIKKELLISLENDDKQYVHR